LIKGSGLGIIENIGIIALSTAEKQQ
jgi:hypothetical protein